MDIMENKKRECGIFLVVLFLGLCISGGMYLYRARLVKEAEIQIIEPSLGAPWESDSELDNFDMDEVYLNQPEVFWNGKKYKRNTYIKAILCIGVDRKNAMTEYKELGEAGQADGIYVLAHDTARNQLKILMVPRDTITEISILSADGSERMKQTDHLLMAYAYGDGREVSCENMVDSVSTLFHGLQIDSYIASSLSVIGELNDAVGGVTVTVPTPGMEKADPAFIEGETVTLKGEQAEKFVRYRDIEIDHSAIFRMNQQKEYMARFFDALRQKTKQDSRIVENLFSLMEGYMITDMEKEQYLKLALDVVESDGVSEGAFYMVPGTDVTTDAFDEFHADEEQMIQVLLDMFYREG